MSSSTALLWRSNEHIAQTPCTYQHTQTPTHNNNTPKLQIKQPRSISRSHKQSTGWVVAKICAKHVNLRVVSVRLRGPRTSTLKLCSFCVFCPSVDYIYISMLTWRHSSRFLPPSSPPLHSTHLSFHVTITHALQSPPTPKEVFRRFVWSHTHTPPP